MAAHMPDEKLGDTLVVVLTSNANDLSMTPAAAAPPVVASTDEIPSTVTTSNSGASAASTNNNTAAAAGSVAVTVDADPVDEQQPPVAPGGMGMRLSWLDYSHRRRCRRTRAGVQHGGFVVTGIRNLQIRHGQWTCFFCCHVTTGTAIIGAWHVLLHILALSLLSIALVYPELLTAPPSTGGGLVHNRFSHQGITAYKDNGGYLLTELQDVQAVNCTRMPCLLATQNNNNRNYHHVAPDFPLTLGHLLSTHQIDSGAISVAVFITLCTLLVTLLLLHGVQRQQPSYVMPFFFLQALDFCISSMTMLRYLSYLPNFRQLLMEMPAFPFREQLLSMQTNCLTFFVLLIFIATFMTKAYCINIVWRCYKYLLLCHAAIVTGQSTATLLAAAAAASATSTGGGRSVLDGGRTNNPAPEHCMQWLMQQDYRSKLPGAYPEPPPSYDMAMAAFQTPDNNTGGSSSSNNNNTVVVVGASATAAPPYTLDLESSNTPGAVVEGDVQRNLTTADAPLLPRYEDAVRAAALDQGGATSRTPQNV